MKTLPKKSWIWVALRLLLFAFIFLATLRRPVPIERPFGLAIGDDILGGAAAFVMAFAFLYIYATRLPPDTRIERSSWLLRPIFSEPFAIYMFFSDFLITVGGSMVLREWIDATLQSNIAVLTLLFGFAFRLAFYATLALFPRLTARA
jgi:hypothetical protein